ncbi:MAG TPA: polymer-forming cytoskeletal protein [Polyangiales bacterium]|jgi:cytoskeletal protein CcmA (bactofilin family)|nr:polymer-forming cytoskeletal protein [Polyangiales bacterium]
MFGSKTKASATEPTVIGRGTVIEGTVRVSGRVQVDGQIDGSLIAEGHVSVGPSGSIVGEVIADQLAVGGRVEGKVTVREHLHIAPGGSTRGELRYGSLQVDRGGVIDGSTLHGEGPSANDVSADEETSSDVQSAPPPLPAAGRAMSVVS